MKRIAARAILAGMLASALMGGAVIALERVAHSATSAGVLSWPMQAYIVSGVPLAWLLEHMPGYGGPWQTLGSDGAMGTGILKLLLAGWLTWAAAIATVLWLRWRKPPAAGPNNSSKPTPLRGAA